MIRQINQQFLHACQSSGSWSSITCKVGSPQKLDELLATGNVTGLRRLTSTALLQDTHIFRLSGLIRLECLSLRACPDVTTFHPLTQLTCLTHLAISSQQLTDEVLIEIFDINMNSLQHVDIRRCRAVTDSGVATLSRLPKLRSLTLNRCSRLTDVCVSDLANTTSLESLNFNRCRWLTDRCCSWMKNLLQLQHLDLRHCSDLTDLGITDLVQITSLRSLCVSCCPLLTEDSYAPLLTCLQLKYLDLRGSGIPEKEEGRNGLQIKWN